ncbi:MAG: phosphoribosylglycinamide formyltransferase [Nitrospirae bacterium]|nr:phosphoribosylglycinamide formyltransferase [Nitrospirota bacterium]MBF0540050.1 phosphoribosylglycinamide formyltransferase [Nitrospirota bacterium]
MIKLGILASGRGSNFQSIIDSIKNDYLSAEIKILITDNPDAYAINRAKENNIPYVCLKMSKSKSEYYEMVVEQLQKNEVELVILAGFMRIVARPLLDVYKMRIMNIHPALLPSFRGLHGQRQALEYGVKIAGCTVHFVDDGVDTGPIITQAAVPVYSDDTEDSISQRILALEHKIYPYAIKLFSEDRLVIYDNIVTILNEIKSDDKLFVPTQKIS